MRLSTAQVYDSGINGMLRNQYALYRIQNQMATSRRVVTPEDDPVAAAQALATEQKQNVNAQFLDNQGNASAQLKELESLMSSVGSLLVDVKARWVEAGNGTYTESQLRDLAVDVRAKCAELLSIANNADAHGQYRFAGFQAGTQPFSNVNGVVSYQGDDGERMIQVETSRFLAVNYSGRAFFEAVPEGNGAFVTGADPGNTGVIRNGTLVNGSVYNGHSYTLTFTSPTSYDLTDTYDGVTTTTSAIPYTPGATITLGGAQLDFTLPPGTGDVFTVDPSREESMFETLQKFAELLETETPNTPDFLNSMLRVGISLDQAIQHVSDNRAVVGTRMAELESLTFLDSDLEVQYKAQISNLVDLDYNAASSALSKNLLQLQAAQQSFLKVTSLSLFNYI
jgi:flagellar hook-associated protein 3 FlgL